MRVEERKAALEQLERRIFPTGRPVIQREDSQGTPDSAQAADDECAKKTEFYENAFLKLKEATGKFQTVYKPFFYFYIKRSTFAIDTCRSNRNRGSTSAFFGSKRNKVSPDIFKKSHRG